jgi:hypothetical protein
MKKCTKCHIEKDVSEFNKNKSKKDGLQTLCKECGREKSKSYYKDNHDKHIKEIGKRKKKVVNENRKILYEHYLANPCVDCGETDIYTLELDHQRDKDMAVSKAVGRGWCKQRLLDEIAKCVVRCANCHRKKTGKEQGWYKDLMGR